MLKSWSELPEKMRNDEVKKYYKILSKKKSALRIKRIADVFLAFIFMILLSPVMIFIACWIKIDSKGPVFYRQERITSYGKQATLLLPAGITSNTSIEYKDEDEIIDAYRAKGITDVDEIYLNYILPEKMKYNLKYIETFGFFSDMKIMLRTAMAVIK